jgi:hypothetical protein
MAHAEVAGYQASVGACVSTTVSAVAAEIGNADESSFPSNRSERLIFFLFDDCSQDRKLICQSHPTA